MGSSFKRTEHIPRRKIPIHMLAECVVDLVENEIRTDRPTSASGGGKAIPLKSKNQSLISARCSFNKTIGALE
jgi:hypothetical protein